MGIGEAAGAWLQLGWLWAASVTSSLKYLLHLLLVIAERQLFNEGHLDGEPLGHVCLHCLYFYHARRNAHFGGVFTNGIWARAGTTSFGSQENSLGCFFSVPSGHGGC